MIYKLNKSLCLRLRSLIFSICSNSKTLSPDNSGAVALIFALLLIPLVLICGGGIDLAFAYLSRDKLQQTVDGSATSIVTAVGDAISTGSSTQTVTALANTQMASFCDSFQKANAQIQSANCAITLNISGLTVQANITAGAIYNTFFLGIIGIPQIVIGKSAQAELKLAPYIDFYMLLDNSPSMGIAATVQDMTTLASATGGCEFACHDTGEPARNTYQIARNIGVTLRIDEVKSAAQQLVRYAGAQTAASHYRMAAYSFGVEAYPNVIGLTQLAALSSNFGTVQNQLGALDLMWLPANNTWNNDDSDIDGMLVALNKQIPIPGDGSSTSASQAIIFLVTDGAADIAPPNPANNIYWSSSGIYPGSSSSPCITKYNDVNSYHCMQPITVSVCNAIKAKGVKIAALYTTYYRYSNSSEYPTYIAPIASAIPSNMQQCASPGLYFEVNPSSGGIAAALEALFETAVSQGARLSK